jgi:biotin carboxylase
VIVIGKDKQEAKERMINALQNFIIEGEDVKTTIPYHLIKLNEL